MKKKVVAGLVVVLILALALPIAFAADSGTSEPPVKRPVFTFDKTQLDDNELNELKAIHDQMVTLRKQMLQKYVDFGALSQENADRLTARMDAMAELHAAKGFIPGFGHGMKSKIRGKMGGKIEGKMNGKMEGKMNGKMEGFRGGRDIAPPTT